MEKIIFDIEIYPNLFMVTFLNIANQEKNVFTIYKKKDDRKLLNDFINRDILLIGYNCISYDSPILVYIQNNLETKGINAELAKLSANLIDDSSRNDGNIKKLRYPKDLPWHQLDLMKIMAFDKLGIGLKQVGINLRWKKIQDLPFPYDHKILPEEVPLVALYNLNDANITYEMYKTILPRIELRNELSKLYNVDLTNASDSKMANVILEKIYTRELGVDVRELRDLRTKREEVLLGDCVAHNIEFKTPPLQKLKMSIENTTVRRVNNYAYKKSIKFGGVEYETGVGGLHSVDDPKLFKSSNDVQIIDCDINSYYPYVMINNELVPEHLEKTFTDILRTITSERITAKKTGDKVRAEALKITINSVFGKTNSETFWLEDAKVFLSVTVSGQLYMLMLIESLVLGGIQVISANTDGIVSKIPIQLERNYKEICKNWEEKTGFVLEFSNYETYARSDVNNYITKKYDGIIKSKGRYVTEISLNKGYKYPIVAKCLHDYFINNVTVSDSILKCKDILEFCISQKTGGDFVLQYHDNGIATDLQKNNRFYVSNNGGTLIKHHKIRENNIGLMVGHSCQLLNDYNESKPFQDYDVNLSFYKDEAQKYIDRIVEDDDATFVYEENVDEEFSNSSLSPEDELIKTEILTQLRGIKNFANNVVENLIQLRNTFEGKDFLELLIFAEDNGLLSLKYEDLIKVGYFSKYGKNRKLLEIFDEFKRGKSKYTAKLSDKSKHSRKIILRYVWDRLEDESLGMMEQIHSDIRILGRVNSKFDVNFRYCYVMGVDQKYSPKLSLYCLSRGTTQTFKVEKKAFTKNPVIEGSIIYCTEFEKKDPVKFVEGEYIKTGGEKVWWLTDYRPINSKEEETLGKENHEKTN